MKKDRWECVCLSVCLSVCKGVVVVEVGGGREGWKQEHPWLNFPPSFRYDTTGIPQQWYFNFFDVSEDLLFQSPFRRHRCCHCGLNYATVQIFLNLDSASLQSRVILQLLAEMSNKDDSNGNDNNNNNGSRSNNNNDEGGATIWLL